MLDQDTKRKIDAARDILVGIVPDPKAQVNQITIALMYKFMDDMDRASAQAGGKASFLAGDFSQYSWAKLMDKRLSSAARMDLYVRAIGEMPKNPGIPQLFRDIFKEAFLPFRNARTLNLFLTEIDGFDYDHSENLGNAFEYLLSIMGAQGDAGQFRTPRHIIDFMVEVVSPQKNENILDPACGTAGFLISAYKYIFRQKPALTPQEKTKLTKNIVGYDISPDMVKLALVNMFLHRFVAPKIHEYDTLTSEERWGHDFDVVLANPPFMTPKGGIEPHSKFRIRANRAEVLFVDYIAEHLTLKGRAGIVVPEGIIFQSANAYKNLRKALVEEWGLYAVASLPNGVFSPYSGVKTSVLFINRELAKRTDKILFVKAENDGFNLGAQRRPIEKNDLPACLAALRLWQKNQTIAKNCNVGFAVEKEKIAEGGEYNLTAERYRETEIYANTKWEMVALGDVVIEMKDGGTPPRKNPDNFGGKINWCVVKDIKSKIHTTQECLTEEGLKNCSAKIWPAGSIIISLGATIGNVGIAKIPVATKQGLSGIVVNKEKALAEYLYYILLSKKAFIQSLATGVSIKEVRPSKLKKALKIPLPPLSVQKEIVAEIEQWQKVIDGAKQVTENWKPKIHIASEWSLAKLKDLCHLVRGVTYSKKDEVAKGGQEVLRANNIDFGGDLNLTDIKRVKKDFNESQKLVKNDIFICLASGSKKHIGKVAFIDNNTNFYFGGFMGCIRVKAKVEPKYLFWMLNSPKFNAYLAKQISGVNINNLGKDILYGYEIPLPPLSKQKEIVAAVEAEQKAVDKCKKLIAAMEKKIAAKIAEVWGE